MFQIPKKHIRFLEYKYKIQRQSLLFTLYADLPIVAPINYVFMWVQCVFEA